MIIYDVNYDIGWFYFWARWCLICDIRTFSKLICCTCNIDLRFIRSTFIAKYNGKVLSVMLIGYIISNIYKVNARYWCTLAIRFAGISIILPNKSFLVDLAYQMTNKVIFYDWIRLTYFYTWVSCVIMCYYNNINYKLHVFRMLIYRG